MARKHESNVAFLRRLMDTHNLSRVETAELAMVSKGTIDAWLAPESAACHRTMPDRAAELIRMRAAERLKGST